MASVVMVVIQTTYNEYINIKQRCNLRALKWYFTKYASILEKIEMPMTDF